MNASARRAVGHGHPRVRDHDGRRGNDAAVRTDLHVERGGDRSVRLHRRVRAGRGHRSLARASSHSHLVPGTNTRNERKQGRPNVRGRDLVAVRGLRARGLLRRVRRRARARCGRTTASSPSGSARSAPTSSLGASGSATPAFRSAGITFTVYGEDEGLERTFPMDLVPRIIPADEWAHVEQGLVQRVTALNTFLDDLYVGERAAVHDGIVPRELVTSSTASSARRSGIPVPHGRPLPRRRHRPRARRRRHLPRARGQPAQPERHLLRAREPRRDDPRAAERVRRPPGAAGRPLRPRRCSQRSAPRRAGGRGRRRRVVVLTPGVFNSAYFEHAFLARQMGVELVEGRDLVVDDHVVYMRTTRGLQRVDVIYRRIDDAFLDPVVFRRDSTLGVPGLMAAARAGQRHDRERGRQRRRRRQGGVRLRARPHPLLPRRGADPAQRRRPTSCGTRTSATHVLDRLDELVVKPVAESGGYGMLIGPRASRRGARGRAARASRPTRAATSRRRSCRSRGTRRWSTTTSRAATSTCGRSCSSGERIEVIPGGLTRVALRKGSLVVNSSQGGGSKDTWVLARRTRD